VLDLRVINWVKSFTLNSFNTTTVSHFRQFCNLEVIMVICVLIAAVGFNIAHLYSYSSTSVKVSLGSDMVMHLLLSEAVVSAMVEGWNVTDVWEGSMGMGHPVFHYYQHLPHLIVGLINVVTFGAISVGNILIWSTFLLLSVFPLSMYVSLRRFGFDPLSSAMGGLVASLISTNGTFGFDYSSYIQTEVGLYTQLWGMVLLPLALAWGYRVLQEGRGYFWAVLFLSAISMSHLLYGYMALLTLGVFTLISPLHFILTKAIRTQISTRSYRRRTSRRSAGNQLKPASPVLASISAAEYTRSQWIRFAMLILLVGMVTSYFVIPFFLDQAYLNNSILDPVFLDSTTYNSLGHAEVLQTLFEGHLFDFSRFPSLTILVFIGFVVCVFRWRTGIYIVPIIVFILWILLYFGRTTWGPVIDLLPMSQGIHMYRFIGGVHLGGILLMATALGVSWRWVLSRGNAWYTAVALIFTISILVPVYLERREYLQQETRLMEECQPLEEAEYQDMSDLLAELESLPKGRVYAGYAGPILGDDIPWSAYYGIGCSHIQSWLHVEGLDMMGTRYHPYSLNAKLLLEFDEAREEQYNIFNVRYVIAPEGIKFPYFVKPVGKFGRHLLYQVETTGYFDLVGSEMAFAGSKDDLSPAASTWISSGLPELKLHPKIFLDESDSKETGIPLVDAPESMSSGERISVSERGRVVTEEIGTNYFAADVEVGYKSILLLKASYHPNWRATVNGAQSDALMFMPGFVGVELPPGKYHVRMEYRSRQLRTILIVLGGLTLVLLAWCELRRERIFNWLTRT